jgi:nucleotide-binding universal stress UspA family protein
MSVVHQVAPGRAPDLRLKIRKIAVFTDFSKGSDAALKNAAILARAYNASIVLAHAFIPPLTAPETPFAHELFDDVRQSLVGRLATETTAPFLHDINCISLLSIGGTQDLLGAVSDADLIVVGASGGSGFKKVALGSTAEAIFRSSHIPVLTVGPHCLSSGEAPSPVKTVLYATDFSPGADIALPYAVSMARTHEAELMLLHVRDSKDAPFSFDQAMASVDPLERLHKLSLDDNGLKYKPIFTVGFGTPDAIILEEAIAHNAGLIVMGARGAGAFSGVVSHFGGGTAYRVAARAICPVLTIRK